MVLLETVERLAGYQAGMNGQALINGNFDLWGGGTSVAYTDDISFAYLANNWYTYIQKDGGTLPTVTTSRQLAGLSGSKYCFRINTSGAGTSLGTASRHNFGQQIKNGVRLLCTGGNNVTVSFYAKSSVANKRIGVVMFQNYGTGGTPTTTEVINGTSWTLTTDWVKYEHTFTTNTTVGKTFGSDNNDYLEVTLCDMWGSTIVSRFDTTTAETYVGSGYVDIAQVQLVQGSNSLPFSPKPIGEEEQNSIATNTDVPYAIAHFTNSSGNYSITSTSYNYIDSTNAKATMTVKSGKCIMVDLWIEGLWNNNSGYGVNFQIGVDGTSTLATLGATYTTLAGWGANWATDGTSKVGAWFRFYITNVAIGSRSFYALWNSGNAGVTAYIGQYARNRIAVTELY